MILLLTLFFNPAYANQAVLSCVYPCKDSTSFGLSSSAVNAANDLSRIRHSYSNHNEMEQRTHQASIQELQIQAQERFQNTYGRTHLKQPRVFREIEETAKKYLDIVVGMEPVSHFTRSNYEWLTGMNLVTKQPLTFFEQSVAFMGIVTLGGEAPVTKLLTFAKSATHLFNVPQMELTMAYGRSLIKSSVGKVYELIQTVGHIKISEGFKFFSSKPAKFRHNQVFARVVPKSAVDSILSAEGGLSLENEAFITVYNDIKNYKYDKWVLAQRLALYKDSAKYELRDISDHVMIKFKLTELKELPVDASKYRGYIPTGETLGGATEYIIPSDALKRGLIEMNTIEIEELF